MPGSDHSLPPAVIEFIQRHVPSVEQLEVLLLLRRTRPKAWSCEDICRDLGSSFASIVQRCEDLARRGFIRAEGPGWAYAAEGQRDEAVALVEETYRVRRVSVITAIASRPNEQLRTLADAFRLRPNQPKEP
jgi:hypothetical protein